MLHKISVQIFLRAKNSLQFVCRCAQLTLSPTRLGAVAQPPWWIAQRPPTRTSRRTFTQCLPSAIHVMRARLPDVALGTVEAAGVHTMFIVQYCEFMYGGSRRDAGGLSVAALSFEGFSTPA